MPSTRSMATRSMATTRPAESPAKPKSAAGKSRRKVKEANEPEPEPKATSNSAASTSTKLQPPPTTISKKITKPRQKLRNKTISISSDEEENKKTEEAVEEKFAVPKGRAKKKKEKSVSELNSDVTNPPSIASSKKNKPAVKLVEFDTESSEDDGRRSTRSSARVKAKKAIPEVKDTKTNEKKQTAEVTTTKRNASKRVLEPRNEIDNPKSVSTKDNPKSTTKTAKGSKRIPVNRKQEVHEDHDDESDGEDMFEEILISKSSSRKQGTKSKLKGGKAVNVKTTTPEVQEKVEQEPVKDGKNLRSRKINLVDKLNIEPAVFASQCRSIASVLLEPSAVRKMNLKMNEFQRFQDDFKQRHERVVAAYKERKQAEKNDMKDQETIPIDSPPADLECKIVTGAPSQERRSRGSEDIFSSFNEMDDQKIKQSPPSKVIKRGTVSPQTVKNKNKSPSGGSSPKTISPISTQATNTKITTQREETVSDKLIENVESLRESKRADSGFSSLTSLTSRGVSNNGITLSCGKKQMGVKRTISEIEIEEQVESAVHVPLNFNFQASAEIAQGTQATKKFLFDACPSKFPSGPMGPSSLTTIDERIHTLPTQSTDKTFIKGAHLFPPVPADATFVKGINLLPPVSADATFVKLTGSNEADCHESALNRTFGMEDNNSDKPTDDDYSVPTVADPNDDVDHNESVFENSEVEVEVDNTPAKVVPELSIKKPCLNETVCISKGIPKFAELHSLPPPNANLNLPWPAAASVSTLEMLEEEDEVSVPKQKKDKSQEIPTTKKDPRSNVSSSSSSSSATSTSSFKSATSQPSLYCKGPAKQFGSSTKILETGKPKIDFSATKKNAFEREEEAKRKKAELLQQKHELQKKKNEEWRKKAEKIKLDEEQKKAKNPIASKAKFPEVKPILKPPKVVGNPFPFKTLEPPPTFKPSGPMKYKSPTAGPLKGLFQPSGFVRAGTPLRPIPKDDSFKTPSSSFLDTTSDMTVNSYDITVYEELDEDLKHRENKYIPEWVQNKQGVSSSLFRMVPFRDYRVSQTCFPKVQRGFRLYGSGSGPRRH